MAKYSREPIRVEAYVTIDGKEVNMDTLSPEMRNRVGTALKVAWLNGLFKGQAVFTAGEVK